MMAACTQNKNPFLQEWDTPYGIPPFDKIQLSDYIPAVKEGIKQQKAELDAILNNQEAPTFENTIAAYELSGDILDKVSNVLFNLQETEGSDEMNKIVEEATELITAHSDNISMDKKFFERVKAVYDADQSGLTREQQMVLKNLYQSFTRNGVDLDEESQARLKEINQKIAAAQQKFGTNLLAENNAFKDKFGIPVSSYTSEMTTCEDRARREEMFKAYSSRGNNGNEYGWTFIALTDADGQASAVGPRFHRIFGGDGRHGSVPLQGHEHSDQRRPVVSICYLSAYRRLVLGAKPGRRREEEGRAERQDDLFYKFHIS